MDKPVTNTKQTKPRTSLRIWAWIFGISFLLLGVSFLFRKSFACIPMLLAALVLIPPSAAFIQRTWRPKLSRTERFWTAFVLLLLTAIIASPGATTPDTSSPTSSSTSTTQVPAQPDMNLAVNVTTYSQASGDYSDGDEWVIAIKNLNSFDWNDCTITMNNTYTDHLDFIDTPTDLRDGEATSTDTSMDAMILPESAFSSSDGTRFNPITQVPKEIDVICNQPYAGTWEGSFNN